jgi:hypothetical protein
MCDYRNEASYRKDLAAEKRLEEVDTGAGATRRGSDLDAGGQSWGPSHALRKQNEVGSVSQLRSNTGFNPRKARSKSSKRKRSIDPDTSFVINPRLGMQGRHSLFQQENQTPGLNHGTKVEVSPFCKGKVP